MTIAVYSETERHRINAAVEYVERLQRSGLPHHRQDVTPIPIRSAITAYNTGQQLLIGPSVTRSIGYWTASSPGGLKIGNDLVIDTALTGIKNDTDNIDPAGDGRQMLVQVSWAVTLYRQTRVDGLTAIEIRLRERDENGADVADPVAGTIGRNSTTSVTSGANRGNTINDGPFLMVLDPGHTLDLRAENFIGGDTYTWTVWGSHFTVAERDSYPPPSTL